MAKKNEVGNAAVGYAPLLQLPADPIAGVDVLLGYFRGTQTDIKEVGHAALHVVAWGYGQIDQHRAVEGTKTAAQMQCPPDEECVEVLEKFKQNYSNAKGTKGALAEAVDWKSLLQVVVPLLMQIIQGLLV